MGDVTHPGQAFRLHFEQIDAAVLRRRRQVFPVRTESEAKGEIVEEKERVSREVLPNADDRRVAFACLEDIV